MVEIYCQLAVNLWWYVSKTRFESDVSEQSHLNDFTRTTGCVTQTRMHRRKPASGKQRKAQLQLKRAVKRGDEEIQGSVQKPDRSRKPMPSRHRTNVIGIARSRRLQSSLVKLPPRFLEETKLVASTLALPRPIASEVAIFDNEAITRGQYDDSGALEAESFTILKRPKWRFDMTKEAVDKNEEAMFNKWLTRTDTLVEEWLKKDGDAADNEPRKLTLKMPRSPTYFERNLEVWRQLYVL